MLKKLAKRLVRRPAVRLLQSWGYSPYFAPRMFDLLVNDLVRTRGVGLRQKLWAYRRGFLGKSVVSYGLNEHNYGAYLPDLTYYRLHPVGAPYTQWINDKLTTRYVLAPFAEHLPKCYFHLTRGIVHRLPDLPTNHPADLSGVMALLRRERHLAMKPRSGSHGDGFRKLSYDDGEFSINDRRKSEDAVTSLLRSSRDDLVTEYLFPHRDLAHIWSGTANTLRVTVIADGVPRVVGAFLRFGTAETGVVDNASAGGVFCGVSVGDGAFFKPRRYEEGLLVQCPVHPGSGINIVGTVPYWKEIVDKLREIAAYVPQISWAGYDVIVTDPGFKIIEINSHQTILSLQQYYPLLATRYASDFFGKLCSAKDIRLPIRSEGADACPTPAALTDDDGRSN